METTASVMNYLHFTFFFNFVFSRISKMFNEEERPLKVPSCPWRSTSFSSEDPDGSVYTNNNSAIVIALINRYFLILSQIWTSDIYMAIAHGKVWYSFNGNKVKVFAILLLLFLS